MSRIKLSNVDLAWLRMENPTNPMMITVVLHFIGHINYDRLISLLQVSLGRYRRFRQRIVRPQRMFSRPYWEDDPSYQVENQVEHLALQLPADDSALEELVNGKMNTPLDFSQPLWKVTLVDNHPDGSIIIVRVHHCIADGISLLQVLLDMAHPSPGEPADQAFVDRQNPTGELTYTPNQRALPRKPPYAKIIAATARIVFRSPDPPTILKGPLGKTKKAIWSEPFRVSEIKAIAQKNNATINDVLMAILAGAIRRYLDLHNDNPKKNIRSFVMVNMRSHPSDLELGNKFGIVFLTLPLDHGHPLERLGKIKQGMDLLKASAEYIASYLILNILGLLPEWIEHLATRILDTKGTVVTTNVPGPRQQIYLVGTPIRSIKAWVPQSGRIGVGLSFVSYNDQIGVGVNVDAGLIPDPEQLLELFTDEFKSFQAALPATLPE